MSKKKNGFNFSSAFIYQCIFLPALYLIYATTQFVDIFTVLFLFYFYRTVINNHSGLMDSSSSNSLVKLTGGTPPSEVT